MDDVHMDGDDCDPYCNAGIRQPVLNDETGRSDL